MTDQLLTVATTTSSGQVTVLSAAGEIDHDSRHALDDAAESALREGRIRLVIDLGAVTFCDSGGLSLFVGLHRRTTALGGQLRLACLQPPVTAVLRATNLDRILPLHPTVAEAVNAALPTG
jgi:anti-sigma B factor antagonist